LQNAGRTIVYLRHASIGHLGIFVSGEVARREHRELLGAVETINALPAGLYEMLIDDLPDTQYAVRFEPRRIADIHGEVPPPRDDDREFALVERASSINNSVYDGFIRPWLRPLINEPTADLLRKAHPFHQQQVLWSSSNPALWWLAGSAAQVRNERRPAATDNPLLAWQALFSNQVQDTLNAYRDLRDATQELCFYGVYGALNQLSGNVPTRDLQAHAENHDKALLERLQTALPLGGLMEALVRILFLLDRDSDARGKANLDKLLEQMQRLLQDHSVEPLDLRDTLQTQKMLVLTYPQESLQSLPLLLPETEERQQVLAAVANLLPELLNENAAGHGFWCELHTLLEVPLPGFDLTQPPSEADAVLEQPAPVAKVEVPTPQPTKPRKTSKKPPKK
jgi:hypothetical protein